MRDTVRDIEQKEMDRQLLLAPLPAKNNSDAARLVVLKQVREDFKDLQGLNNRMMSEAWVREELNYKYISESVSQIKAKAARLKSNLALPEAKNVDSQQIEFAARGSKEFRVALLALDRSIMSFVTNPLFQKSNVVEVGLSTRASRDLELIIDLSGNLQKAAKHLYKLTEQGR